MIRWKRRTARHEELEYEPTTVLELLTEMKDLSELMTDLAYSAIILRSDPIGEEVEELGRRMDVLKYHLRLMSSLSVRSKEEATQVAGILQIGDASEHIANAASELVEVMDVKEALGPFLGRVLDEADDCISTLKVPDDSPVDTATLGELNLEQATGLRVLAIRRGQRWVYRPGRDTRLLAGDALVMRGQAESADHFRAYLQGEEADL